MPHVVVGGPLHPSGRQVLDTAADVSVTYIDVTSEESLVAEIANADAVLLRTQPVSEPTIALGKNVKIYSRHGVGYDAVDVDALNRRGIALAVCGDVNSTTVAEHASMLILGACKRILRSDAAVRGGDWEWRNRLEGARYSRAQSFAIRLWAHRAAYRGAHASIWHEYPRL